MHQSLKKAYRTLQLDPNVTYTAENIRSAYKKIVIKVHPDKRPGDANAHAEFIDLSNAYNLVLKALPPEAEAEAKVKVNVTLSVTQAYDTLHATILAVGKKLDSYSDAKALRKILAELPYKLDKDILDEPVRFALILLNETAVALEISINNINKIGTPERSAIGSCIYTTIALANVVFFIALYLSFGVMLNTATLVVLIAIPPVAGLLVGRYAFFYTTQAHKDRSEQQQEMMKIVTAINNLIAVIEEASLEQGSSLSSRK